MFMDQIIGTPILFVNRNTDWPDTYNIGMSIGSRVREARVRAKLTQGQLAAKVGIKQGSLSELETGESVKTTHVVSLAAALGVDALWLETGKGLPYPGDGDPAESKGRPARLILAFDDEEDLLDLFRRTDDRGRLDILKLATREVARVGEK